MNRVLTVSLGIVAWAMCSNAGLAEQRFDGRWSIQAIPERGPCHRVRWFSVWLESSCQKCGLRRAGDNIAGGLEPNGRIQVASSATAHASKLTGCCPTSLDGKLGNGRENKMLWAMDSRKGLDSLKRFQINAAQYRPDGQHERSKTYDHHNCPKGKSSVTTQSRRYPAVSMAEE